MSLVRTGSLLAATVSMGLMAGLFAAFAYAVMPGLARADDRTLVVAMQRVNESILNGWFGICFAGALVFTALAAVLHLSASRRALLPWVLAALLFYLVVLVVTFGFNIPLNNLLADAGDPDRVGDLSALRDRFESAWVRWNVVRAIFSTTGFGLLTWALLLHGRLSE